VVGTHAVPVAVGAVAALFVVLQAVRRLRAAGTDAAEADAPASPATR
jgi:hypothetical protein